MYLFVDVAYVLCLLITGRFVVSGIFAETAHRIMGGSELLYRFGLSCGLIASLCTVFLAMGLYVTVKPIDKNLALLALLFRLVEAAIFGFHFLVSFVVLRLYTDADFGNAFDAKQLSAFLHLRSAIASDGDTIAGIFFCIGSILFFYLFLQSGYIPKILSALGFYGSVLVAITTFSDLLWPQYDKMLQFGTLPIAIAEILVGIWLLVKGVNLRPQETELR